MQLSSPKDKPPEEMQHNKIGVQKKDLSFENQKHNSIQHNPSRIQLNKVKTTQNKKKENFLRTENTKNNRKKKEQERNKTTATDFNKANSPQ